MRHSLTRAAAALALVAATAGCSAAPTPAASAPAATIEKPAPDEPFPTQILGLSCADLLTADEIAVVLGHQVWAARSTADMRLGPPTGLNCNFQTKPNQLNNFTMVIRPLDAQTRKRFGVDNGRKAPIPGLGDRASAGSDGKGADVIAVGPGFILRMSGDGPGGVSRDQMVRISSLVYTRLTTQP